MTALPPASNATNAAATEGDVKSFLTAVRDYLNGLFGSTGVPADARNALGVSNNTVAKTGDTMTGSLAVPSLTVQSTGPLITLADSDYANRHLHHQGGTMGFLDTSGNWAFWEDNGGNLWTKAYGYLHSYFSSRSYVDGTFAHRSQALASVQRYEDPNARYLRNTKVDGTYTDYLWAYVGGGGAD